MAFLRGLGMGLWIMRWSHSGDSEPPEGFVLAITDDTEYVCADTDDENIIGIREA